MTDKKAPWRSRIIGTGTEDPATLIDNPENWRTHPKLQKDALAGVLDEVGWVQQILVNKQTGHIIDGHARVAIAKARGEKSVPVLYVDLTPEEERLVLATLDPLSALAIADHDILDNLLDDLSVEDPTLQGFLDTLNHEVDGMTPQERMAEWEGADMPEFDQGDIQAWKKLSVNFMNQEDLDAFAKLVGQKITPKTIFIYYPPVAPDKIQDMRWAGASEDSKDSEDNETPAQWKD
jgi:hypothetical protein